MQNIVFRFPSGKPLFPVFLQVTLDKTTVMIGSYSRLPLASKHSRFSHLVGYSSMNDESTLLSPTEIDRVIQMAWEDRTPFEAIKIQFGLTPGQVINLMRREMKPSSFKLWRERTVGRSTKHLAKRGFQFGRFRCPDQKGS